MARSRLPRAKFCEWSNVQGLGGRPEGEVAVVEVLEGHGDAGSVEPGVSGFANDFLGVRGHVRGPGDGGMGFRIWGLGFGVFPPPGVSVVEPLFGLALYVRVEIPPRPCERARRLGSVPIRVKMI